MASPLKSLRPSSSRVWTTPFSALLFASALGMSGLPSAAQSPRPGGVTITVDELPANRYIDLVEMLDESGYQIISINRTWLNRIRIRASNQSHLREIVFSQASGEVMRDVILEHYAGRGPTR